jgi:hypothetical protein
MGSLLLCRSTALLLAGKRASLSWIDNEEERPR